MATLDSLDEDVNDSSSPVEVQSAPEPAARASQQREWSKEEWETWNSWWTPSRDNLAMGLGRLALQSLLVGTS